uniref:Uncharacterized protein n=2 Tax=Schizaphis graminum TaxID=13262 RepID=A0A2S2PD07_SCHGA
MKNKDENNETKVIIHDMKKLTLQMLEKEDALLNSKINSQDKNKLLAVYSGISQAYAMLEKWFDKGAPHGPQNTFHGGTNTNNTNFNNNNNNIYNYYYYNVTKSN